MPNETLADACTAWQGGRDTGSSVLRGGARNATGIPHYFSAPYIDAYEVTARGDVAAARSELLLDAVFGSRAQPLGEWQTPDGASAVFAGRGIESKTDHHEDDQIRRVLESGWITMPLWGVSLDERIARSFGERFLFVLDGPFRGVAAWDRSGWKPEEQEVITGGRYEILSIEDTEAVDGPVARVTLRQSEDQLWPR